MTFRSRTVSVKELPQQLNAKAEKLFFRELESSMNVEKPAIVLDCTRVRHMDNQAIHLLLCCLEGALKRNGDVRLCGVTPQGMLNLQLCGVDRVFRVFATAEEAIASYQRRWATTPVGVGEHLSAALAAEPAA